MVSPSSSCPGISVSRTASFTSSFQGFSIKVNSGHLPTALSRRFLIVLNPASRHASRNDSCIAPPQHSLDIPPFNSPPKSQAQEKRIQVDHPSEESVGRKHGDSNGDNVDSPNSCHSLCFLARASIWLEKTGYETSWR